MSVSVNVNGTSYTIPETGDTNWGAQVTAWIQAVSSSTLQKSGGSFILTAEVDFGSSYGVKSLYFKTKTANAAGSGAVRLANADAISFRNSTNAGDIDLKPGASDGRLNYNGVELVGTSLTQTLTNKTLTSPAITNPTGITKSDVGLGNVDNTSDANKPVSTAQQAALDLKYNASNPANYVDSTGAAAAAPVQSVAGKTGVVTLAKGDVGLGNVDNTSDATKNSATATLTNKTLQLPVIDDGADFIEESSISNPSSGRRRLGLKTDGKLYLRDSSGNETAVGTGSGGGINYITNPDAEANTTGWSTYADAAGTAPVDGTGGSPNITWTRSTSSPLRGLANFLITKDAANRQGQGVSYLAVTDRADFAAGAIGNLSFDYEIASGTYADGDLSMWLVGVTSGAVIPFSTLANTTVPGRYTATAQLRTDDDDYRVCIHVASTSASAYTVKFDNFSFGPQIISVGPVVLATEEFPLVIKGTTSDPTLGTASFAKAFKSRTGDRATIQYEYTRTGNGTAGSGDYLYMMPVGWKIDLDVHPVGSVLGEGRVSNQTDGYLSTSLGVRAMVNNESSFKILIEDSSGSPSKKDPRYFLQASSSWGFSDLTPRKLSLTIPAIKIQGWGGTNVLSSDVATTPVVLMAYGPTSSATANNPIPFPNVFRQVGPGSYNGTQFTAAVTGYYRVSASADGTIAAGNAFYVSVNGNTSANGNRPQLCFSPAANAPMVGTATVYVLAGQTIDVRCTANYGAGGGAYNTLQITLDQVGSQQIAASESIKARYDTNGTGQSISAATVTIVNFLNKNYDSHGAVTVGASWKFTASNPGLYSVKTQVSFATTSWTSGNERIMYIYKNGSLYSTIFYYAASGSNSIAAGLTGSDEVPLLAGDYIDIRVFSTAATSLLTQASYNHVAINRVGNY